MFQKVQDLSDPVLTETSIIKAQGGFTSYLINYQVKRVRVHDPCQTFLFHPIRLNIFTHILSLIKGWMQLKILVVFTTKA